PRGAHPPDSPLARTRAFAAFARRRLSSVASCDDTASSPQEGEEGRHEENRKDRRQGKPTEDDGSDSSIQLTTCTRRQDHGEEPSERRECTHEDRSNAGSHGFPG